jgi:hypothetical protein
MSRLFGALNWLLQDLDSAVALTFPNYSEHEACLRKAGAQSSQFERLDFQSIGSS